MDNKEEKKGKEAKNLSAEQPIVKAKEENKPKEKQVKPEPHEYASDVSESSEVIRNEFKDMYGESEEEMEEEGEEEKKEEEEEEEDLTEFRSQLNEKYMKGVEFSEEYLKKENQKIEDVPLQLYAIETYINSVRCFYVSANHWVRIKIFNAPCFEIRPCNKVNLQASMYANRSINLSKGN